MLKVRHGSNKRYVPREFNVVVSRPLVLHQSCAWRLVFADTRHLYANINQMVPLENMLGVIERSDQYGKQLGILSLLPAITGVLR